MTLNISKKQEEKNVKKIISLLIAMVMLISCMSMPAAASNIAAGIQLKVEYSTATQVIKLSGTMSEVAGRNWATFYLLNPGKNRDDIPNHTMQDPVFSHCGEFNAKKDGTFSYEFKITEEPGLYTLYFTTGYAHITREIDTTKDVVSEPSRLESLRALGRTYSAPKGTTVKELFNEKVAELPKEMPVMRPVDIEGLSEVFVDIKNGNDDTADGTIDNPFKTITQALKKNPPEKGMVLYLREGTYPMTDRIKLSGLEFDEELPFIISNYNDEEVVITGGEELDANEFENVTDQNIIKKLDPSVINKIKVIDLKNKYGMTSYGDITKDSQPILMVGDSKYQIARWPNSENTVMRKYTGEDGENGVIDSGYINVGIGSTTGPNRKYSKRATANNAAAGEVVDTDRGIQFCVEDARPFSWEDTGDIWMYGKFYDDWTLDHLNISEFHPENRSVRTSDGVSWGAQYVNRPGYENTFYYYNVVEELDGPGEWFMDKETGKLYVYPTGNLKDQKITYAYDNQAEMVYIANCKNVIINGIRFSTARRRGINIAGPYGEGILIQNCSFDNLNNGIYIEGNYNGVIDSTFKDLAAKGVALAGNSPAEQKALEASRLFVQNCVFYNTKGISNNGVGNIVSHNFVSNNIGTCISSTGNENIIEYNEITGGPREVLDAGCIYVNGNNLFSRGTHVRYNYIHDGPSSDSRGIYFDDMLSENYGYGNIMDGVWFQIHTGSENTVYNNIMMNYPDKGVLRIGLNYWNASKNASTRWVTGALNYGSLSKNLLKSQGYGGDEDANTLTGPYADRYPLLKKWAEYMYQRIDEYEAAGKTTTAAKTSSITSPYTHKYYKKYYSTSATSEKVDINQYLAAVKDTYVANNVMINTGTNEIDNTKHTQGRNNGKYNAKFGGYINTVDENNVYLTTAQNPFKNKNYADESAYETLRQSVPGFESIPFEKIGLLSEEDYTVNEKTHSISPVDTVEVTISSKDLSLKWAAVAGAQKYTVTLASDPDFKNVVETATTYDLSYKVETSLDSDKTYYWRVATEANAKCSTGEVEISDTFKFKTMSDSVSAGERNEVGVTVYSVDNMEADTFKVTTYGYNLTDSAKNVTIHIACYDENNMLLSTKKQVVAVPADVASVTANVSTSSSQTVNKSVVTGDVTKDGAFTSEIVFSVTAPNTKKIKLFVWDAEGNMIPYTFARTIQ